MTEHLTTHTGLGLLEPDAPAPLQTLLQERRSIRRLRDVDLSEEALARLADAVRLTPATYNLPPRHVVLIRDRRDELGAIVEGAMLATLDGDRLERNLARIAGFRPGAAVALVYEDRTVQPRLREAWRITDEQATAFVQQGLGMVQLALWLALTEEGLVTSLQHWDWLLPDGLTDFAGLPPDRFTLAAVLPIGLPDEPPRPAERVPTSTVFSVDRAT